MVKTEKILLNLLASMNAAGQASLVEYAQFLVTRHPAKTVSVSPLKIERPADESVIAAIKRLSRTYPMLDKEALLHETSSFMTLHVMQGRKATEIIDEMEVYFRQQYEQFCLRKQNDSDA